MPYFPLALSHDDRREKQGCAPLKLVNAYVRQSPPGSAQARRAPYFICPAPGRTERVEVDNNVRGLFASPGCRNGVLHVANGANLTEVSSTYSYSNVATSLTGADVVQMRADRAALALLSNGLMYHWNGTLTQVSDADAPNPASTLTIVARRWVAAFEDNDAFGWSAAGDYSTWPTDGQAADQDLPDLIVGQENIGEDLWSFNAENSYVWQPTGGAEDAAFARVQGVTIPRGLAARDAFARVGAGGMILAHNRQVHGTSGMSLEPIPNPDLEQALKALTPTQLSACKAWSYLDGGKEFWGLSAGLRLGYVYDTETQLWHAREKYNASTYDIDFVAVAYGKVFCASKNSNKIWTLDDDVFVDGQDSDDADIPIQRTFTLHIPASGDVPVDRLVWDMTTRAVPVTGQGSSPVMMVRTSNDNGESWSDWRDISLPTASSKFRIDDWGFGLASHEHGMLVEHLISDPIGFQVRGVWVNPTEEELNA